MTNQSNKEIVESKLIKLGWVSFNSDGKLWFMYSSEDFIETDHSEKYASRLLDSYGIDYNISEKVGTYYEYDMYEEPIDEHMVKVVTIVIHD